MVTIAAVEDEDEDGIVTKGEGRGRCVGVEGGVDGAVKGVDVDEMEGTNGEDNILRGVEGVEGVVVVVIVVCIFDEDGVGFIRLESFIIISGEE